MIETATGPKSASATLSCAIVAEERLVRELLASALTIRAGVHVVAHTGFDTGQTQGVADQPPDLLVLSLPAKSGGAKDVVRPYLAARPDGHVLVLTEPGCGFTPPAWLAARLVAVVDRDGPLQSLWAAIDAIQPADADADPLRPTACTSFLRRRLGGRALSAREAAIFACIGEGLTTRDISDRLGLSAHTVRTHRRRIAAKLGTVGADLTRRAILSKMAGHVPASGRPVSAE